jgi:predicted TIM-barrel fold metal-dependent hydrolase
MEIIDAHSHFLSYNYFRLLTQQRKQFGPIDDFIVERARRFGFDVPPSDPVRLADLWAIEMDKYNVDRVVSFSSISGDSSSVAAALRTYRDRFIGVATINPYLSVAEELIEHNVREWGFRGIALYPCLHRFMASSEQVYPLFRLARRYRLAVYVHFGHLRIPPRKWWDLPDLYDSHYADPADLHNAAADFPTVNFIVPSFGAGTLHQLLRLGLQCPNVYIDTSSSNHWIMDQSEFTSLREVFERTLEVFGPARMLFGTDSGIFPRGWRHTIYKEQMDIMRSLRLSDRAIAAIMGQNARQVFGLDRDIPSYMI